MSGPMSLNTAAATTGRAPIALRTRLLVLSASAVAKAIAHLGPARIRAVLIVIRGHVPAATITDATAAHADVVRLVPHARGVFGCLQRSLTITLVLRARGAWPTWCVGVRTQAPFAAHAWIEAQSQLIGESVPTNALASMIRIPAAHDDESRHD